jgi:hypothetical protein
VLTSSAVDRGYDLGSGNTKDYEIGICCFSAKKSLKIPKGQSESLYQRTVKFYLVKKINNATIDEPVIVV